MSTAALVSGGVDSSVALRLLLEEGAGEVRAFYLKVWLEDELADLGSCPWEEDLEYARQVCDGAGVPLEVVSLQREYHERVVSYVLSELRAGRTPSPDLLCNSQIKFGAFLDHLEGSFDAVASGHYARRLDGPPDLPPRLGRSPDPVKDQTYFLARLRPEQLALCRFPLGPYRKEEVRALARRFDLPNQARPDSQGICFLGKIPFGEFVRRHLGEAPGEIREAGTGRVLGEHSGHWFYTVGQRRGLGLSGGPWFVVEKDVEENVILVTHGTGLEQKARRRFPVTDLHWLGPPPEEDLLASGSLLIKLRHGPSLLPGRLILDDEGQGIVELSEADPGVAPGQFAVFYDGEVCFGSGVIQ